MSFVVSTSDYGSGNILNYIGTHSCTLGRIGLEGGKFVSYREVMSFSVYSDTIFVVLSDANNL